MKKEINLGDIFWFIAEGDIAHPHVVINLDSEKATICSITTNTKKLNMPGNVILDPGEGNLDKQSIVEVSKTFVVNKEELKDFIGTLSSDRIAEVQKGIGFLKRTYFVN
ncbi:MAG: type II toxin-antitoxin system PemK/MazF family toxin [Candidatus Dojkabacteria bacterium]